MPPQPMGVQHYVNPQRTSGLAIASMVLGIVGLAIVVVGVLAFAAFRTTSSSIGFVVVILARR